MMWKDGKEYFLKRMNGQMVWESVEHQRKLEAYWDKIVSEPVPRCPTEWEIVKAEGWMAATTYIVLTPFVIIAVILIPDVWLKRWYRSLFGDVHRG